MITIYNKNIFDNKEQLTAPKTSDRFILDINLNNGQRPYKVLIGRKWIFFRPVDNQATIKKSVTQGKRILYNKYWNAARVDAHYEYCVGDNKRKSLPKNWKEAY